MCGITGWVDFSRDLTRERASIEAMTETMACRGPDASGIWSEYVAPARICASSGSGYNAIRATI